MLLLSILLSGTLSAQSPSRMLEMADAALENHQYEKALELYDRCLAADASLKEAYRGRALVRERLGKTDEALTDYNVYLSMHPEHYEALFSRAALNEVNRRIDSPISKSAIEYEFHVARSFELFENHLVHS